MKKRKSKKRMFLFTLLVVIAYGTILSITIGVDSAVGSEAEREVDILAAELGDLHSILSDKWDELGELREVLNHESSVLTELQGRLIELNETFIEVRNASDILENKTIPDAIYAYGRMMADGINQRDTLLNSLADLTQERDRIISMGEAVSHEILQQISSAQSAVDAANAVINDIRSASQEAIDRYEALLLSHRNEALAFAEEQYQLRHYIEQYRSRREDAASQVDTQLEQIAALGQRVENLRDEATGLYAIASELKEEVEEYSATLMALRDEYEYIQTRIQAREAADN